MWKMPYTYTELTKKWEFHPSPFAQICTKFKFNIIWNSVVSQTHSFDLAQVESVITNRLHSSHLIDSNFSNNFSNKIPLGILAISRWCYQMQRNPTVLLSLLMICAIFNDILLISTFLKYFFSKSTLFSRKISIFNRLDLSRIGQMTWS